MPEHERRTFVAWLGAGAALALAGCQKSERIPRVALVMGTPPVAAITGDDPADPLTRAFVHGLRDLGLVDGRNVILERRSAEGRGRERMTALLEEIVARDVDVIVTAAEGALIAQRLTSRIPIVTLADDPQGLGLIDSLGRPGRNVTGVGEGPEGYGKALQLLKEAAPNIARVAVVAPRPMPGTSGGWRAAIDAAAREMGLAVIWVGVDAPDQFDAAFATIVRERADALFEAPSAVNFANSQRVAQFALEHRLPSYGTPRAGMLVSYGVSGRESFRRMAWFVKQILDGKKPADLPFEQLTKVNIIVNARTARALGLTLPQSLLLQASEVIQ